MNLIPGIDKYVSVFLHRKGAAIFTFTLTGLICLVPFLAQTPFLYAPDAGTHLFNVQQFAKAFHEGVIYPRWLPIAVTAAWSSNEISARCHKIRPGNSPVLKR